VYKFLIEPLDLAQCNQMTLLDLVIQYETLVMREIILKSLVKSFLFTFQRQGVLNELNASS